MAKEKYTSEQIIEAVRKSYGLVYIAAKNLGCDPHTIYHRAKVVKAVQQAIDDSRSIVIDQAENKLFNAIDHGEPWAIALMLRTLGKSRGYTERHELDIDTSKMSDEQLAERVGPILARLGISLVAPDAKRVQGDADPASDGGGEG